MRRDGGATCQPMTCGYHDICHVGGERGRVQVLGDRKRNVAPAVRDPDIGLPGGDQLDGVPGLPLSELQLEAGMRLVQRADAGSHESAHRRRERGEPQATCHCPGLLVQPGLDALEVGQQPSTCFDQVSALAGQHDASTDPLEQRHAGLAFQSLHLLRDCARREPEGVGGRDHGPVGVHRA